jgi:hypothetical protein
MHFVRDVSYISGYKLLLTFEDETIRLADLKPYLDGKIFELLKNADYFKTVRVDPELDTIIWENGADMSPDFLYEISLEVNELLLNAVFK